MSQIELVTALPNWHWSANSQREILMTGEDLLRMSDFVWQIRDVALAGFIHSNLLTPPWMWFLLADRVTIGDLIDFRRLSSRIPQGTLTAVRADYKVGLKFAESYGFVRTGDIAQHFGDPYVLMRKM